MSENPIKYGFLSWCLRILGPGILLWLGFVFLFLTSRISGWTLVSGGLVAVAILSASLYLFVLMTAARWPLPWRFWILAMALIGGVGIAKTMFVLGLVLNTPGMLAVALMSDLVTPEFVVVIREMGIRGSSKFAALLIYGPPLAWPIYGGLAGGLLGWGQSALFDFREPSKEAWAKMHVLGGTLAGLGLGLLLTTFVLTRFEAGTKALLATIWLLTAFMPYLRFTWNKHRKWAP